jgi:hypothetical protein
MLQQVKFSDRKVIKLILHMTQGRFVYVLLYCSKGEGRTWLNDNIYTGCARKSDGFWNDITFKSKVETFINTDR